MSLLFDLMVFDTQSLMLAFTKILLGEFEDV